MDPHLGVCTNASSLIDVSPVREWYHQNSVPHESYILSQTQLSQLEFQNQVLQLLIE